MDRSTPWSPLLRLPTRRRALQGLLGGGACWLAGPLQAQRVDGTQPEASPRWRAVRASLWGERPLEAADPAQLQLVAPARAADPAFVPVALRARAPADAGQALRRLTLVIDQNPSPIAAVFELPPDGALPDLETRVRVDEYSFVRVIGETADGRLTMALRFVKASGGCSAPAGGEAAAQAAEMGRMRWRLLPGAEAGAGQPVTLDWAVQHPNHSGMAMDPLTRQYTPAHFVRSLRLWQGERLLLAADLDFALSENPGLRLRFVPRGEAALRAEVVDSRERRFTGEAAWASLR
ncbi:MAG: quinoprotein dehydrogenase-associated SoxYZ-like carrier [Burkholderiaceae bacterium]|nr:quinoprotein dehydrogenase-associated SoxYZ-like carrier [Burkholderiaceae bacterium]